MIESANQPMEDMRATMDGQNRAPVTAIAQVNQLEADHPGDHEAIYEYTRRAFATFRPPSQTPITDEEIIYELQKAVAIDNRRGWNFKADPPEARWTVSEACIMAFSWSLLAKHPSTISDDQLKALWKLAKTEDLQVFLTDARRVVGR